MKDFIDKAVPESEEERDYVSEVQNLRLIDDILFRNVMDEPKRMRFNVGLIDHHAMLRGETNWENMTDSTVIMFCATDCFGEGKVIYELPRCLNGGRRSDDGTRMIFVNCTYEGDDELGRIIHDLMCRNADDIYDDEIREKVKRIKEDRVEVEKMCETLQREFEEGMEAGAVRERRKMQAELDEKDRRLEEKDRRIRELEKMLEKNTRQKKRKIKFSMF